MSRQGKECGPVIVSGMAMTEHEFSIPLDHADPEGERITVFAREIADAEKRKDELPWLAFFQGGPGFEGPRPTTKSTWLKRALEEYRVLLLDSRGTGRSSQLGFQSLSRRKSAKERADVLKHFRADSIVKDAEWIRKALVGEKKKWSVLGQSFGGFCVVHYLSAAPEALKEAVITGGLPAIHDPIEEIYRATYREVIRRNKLYYERYPDDVAHVKEIVSLLEKRDVRFPSGEKLTPRMFRQLGFHFGMSDGFEIVHYLLESAFVEGAEGRELGHTFLRELENSLSFQTHPIFVVLHEAAYCEGTASRWAAHRLLAEFREFEEPHIFTGEMIYPWMMDDYKYLVPMKEEAEILAAFDGWPALYDHDRLAKNSVPCAAAIYYDDMYVPRILSEKTAASIGGLQTWITNEYHHNGLRSDGEEVLGHLLEMLHGSGK